MIEENGMKCTECEHWDKEENTCAVSDADPTLPPDQDIFCGEAGDIQEDYFNDGRRK